MLPFLPGKPENLQYDPISKSITPRKSMLITFLRRNWEVFLVIVAGLLLIQSFTAISAALIGNHKLVLLSALVSFIDMFHQILHPILSKIFFVLVVPCLFFPSESRHRRFFMDACAIYCFWRLLLLFVLLNALLFAPSPEQQLLLIQIILFLPCFLLMWGWVYWRTDLYSTKTTGRNIFRLDSTESSAPSVYDYFLASFTSLISNSLTGFSGRTPAGRTLIFIHGVMMWDVMWLILIRAIAMRTG